jgi:hypothetical protein
MGPWLSQKPNCKVRQAKRYQRDHRASDSANMAAFSYCLSAE